MVLGVLGRHTRTLAFSKLEGTNCTDAYCSVVLAIVARKALMFRGGAWLVNLMLVSCKLCNSSGSGEGKPRSS
eukprot:510867-Amphidinium_carterae.1